jgi:hypothetical protein
VEDSQQRTVNVRAMQRNDVLHLLLLDGQATGVGEIDPKWRQIVAQLQKSLLIAPSRIGILAPKKK